MKRATTVAAIFAGLLVISSPLAGQQPVPGLRLQITPFGGGGASLTDLPATYRIERDDGSWLQLEGSELDAAPVLGGSVGVRWGRHLGVEGSLAYLPAELSTSIDGQAMDTDLDLFLLSGNVSWFFPVPSRWVEPFVTAGAGAKVYDYDLADTETHTDFSVNLGTGVAFRLSPLVQLRLEARDHISWLDPQVEGLDTETQHNAVFTAGLSVNLPLARPGRR